MQKLEKEYYDHQCWGMAAAIDLGGCHPLLLKNPKQIECLIIGLCQQIKMRRYGKMLIKRFGSGGLEGYSALQFIETSSIAVHCDEQQNRVFIDVFSCKYFDYQKAERFCKKFLHAKHSKARYYFRY